MLFSDTDPYLPSGAPDRDRWGGYAYPPTPCDSGARGYDEGFCQDALGR